MGKNRLNQGHAVPDFVDKFGTALGYFGLKVRETANIKNTGAKGSERELDVAAFAFWFALYNFVDRENRRRERSPYFNYANDLNKFWKRIV